jgi:hypothetical protein
MSMLYLMLHLACLAVFLEVVALDCVSEDEALSSPVS